MNSPSFRAIELLRQPLSPEDLAEAPMFVRLALENDRLAFLMLASSYQGEASEAFPGLSFDPTAANATFGAYLSSANPTVFVVEQRRQIVGFLCASIQAPRFSVGIMTYCEALYVRPDHRGTRAEALLLAEFDQWSIRLKARFSSAIVLNDVLNAQTLRLYEKTGFKQAALHLVKRLEA